MKHATPLFALALLALTAAGPAAADAGSDAIEALGRINGIALACQQPALVSRARNAVQTTAPKTRANGELFENATNAAFLDRGQGTCPDTAYLADQLKAAEARLQDAFREMR